MQIITRKEAIENLEKYINKDLSEIAKAHNITILKDAKINKGWKGQTLEICAGLTVNNKKAPNGLGFELKSVSFISKNGVLIPKETMAITMINKEELKNHSFFESHCWEKLKSLIFCSFLWKDQNQQEAILLNVNSFDFFKSDDIIKEIEKDYEFIRAKLINHGFESLTGKDGKWIQARTKGSGHGSTSRAFYAKKELIKIISNIKYEKFK